MKTICVCLTIFILIVTVGCRIYPLQKQCDSAWGSKKYANSSSTICQSGDLLTSLSMTVSGIGKKYNPESLNSWLLANNCFRNGEIVLYSIGRIGLNFIDLVANQQIKPYLDKGNVVICSIKDKQHYVLAYGYNGDNILVNDPKYTVTSYNLSQLQQDQNIVYEVANGFKGFENVESLIDGNINKQQKERLTRRSEVIFQ